MANPDDARVNAEAIGPTPTEIHHNLSVTARNVISYSLASENDVTSVRFRLNFCSKLRFQTVPALSLSRWDQFRQRSTSQGVMGQKNLITYTLTWENDVTSVRFRMNFFSK